MKFLPFYIEYVFSILSGQVINSFELCSATSWKCLYTHFGRVNKRETLLNILLRMKKQMISIRSSIDCGMPVFVMYEFMIFAYVIIEVCIIF